MAAAPAAFVERESLSHLREAAVQRWELAHAILERAQQLRPRGVGGSEVGRYGGATVRSRWLANAYTPFKPCECTSTSSSGSSPSDRLKLQCDSSGGAHWHTPAPP